MKDWTWHKSSRCESGACVEVGWRKSSRSLENGSCVEVAAAMVTVAVRDSKDPAGGMLKLSRGEWSAFLAGVKAAEFDGAA